VISTLCDVPTASVGKWPQTPVAERIATVERYHKALSKKRDEIVTLLMWEICKTEEVLSDTCTHAAPRV